jgi:uncharacterized damage-inducible protein DinB
MRKLIAGFALTAALALPVAAQEHAAAHVDPVTSTQAIQNQFLGWVIAAAEQVAEADYAYKPVATVRSLGQQFGHVANANFMICSTIRGQANPKDGINHETMDKATIVAALKASATYCADAAKWGAENHHNPVSLFGMKGDVTWAFNFNSSHNAEHYGNIVTYMRMKGMVPPSSQGGM